MRESVGMGQQLNIVLIFIITVFALISASQSYYKAFKVNNVIVDSIEKFEGFNDFSEKEIEKKLATLGYQSGLITCKSKPYPRDEEYLTHGYCVYYESKDSKQYTYKIVTYMYIDLPIVNMFRIPIKSTTKRMCLGKGIESCR